MSKISNKNTLSDYVDVSLANKNNKDELEVRFATKQYNPLTKIKFDKTIEKLRNSGFEIVSSNEYHLNIQTEFFDVPSGRKKISNIRTTIRGLYNIQKYCKTNNIKSIDFLKIDVEGSEHMVLEGFTDLLSKKAIKVIQFEYGYANADVHFLMRDFFKFFERFGYIIGKLIKNGVIFSDFDYKLNDFNSGPNFVAIRNDDIQLKELISCKPILGVGILVKSN